MTTPLPRSAADLIDDLIDTTAGVRVRVHPSLCEGWGNCHRFAAAVYPLDAEGFVDLHLLEVPADLASAARLGADVCPAQAITIINRRTRTDD